MMTASGCAAQHQPFAFGLRARHSATATFGIGADGGDMDQPRTDAAWRRAPLPRRRGLHRIETLAAALEQDADQVDDDIGVAHRRLDRMRIAHIGLHRVDLADPADRLQMAGQFRPAHRDADAIVPVGQRPHHVAAEETRAAEHGDERFEIVFKAIAAKS